MSGKNPSILDPETPVLIVDDSQEYSRVLTRILTSGLGYKTITAVSSADAAIEMITQEPERFSMLFVDYHLPDGATASTLMKDLELRGLLGTKVTFFITAQPEIKKAVEATQAGIAGCVVKPFDRMELRRQIERAEHQLKLNRLTDGEGDAS